MLHQRSPRLKVFFTLPVSSYDETSGNSSGLDCTSGFILRPDSIGLQVLSTGIQSRVLDMCDSLIRTFDIYMSRIYKNKMSALSLYS